jgi:superfamily II DNA or RNA helicase
MKEWLINLSNCKLIIKDEVNIKFEGLSLEARRKLANKFKFEVPWARYQPAYRLGRWDGTVAFFGVGGTGYINQLSKIIPILEDMGYDIEIEDHRKHPAIEFDTIDENFWEGTVWPKGHRFEGQPITLRDDQVEVVNNFLKNSQALQEVATGAGKTIMTATLSKLCEKYGRTMVIVPNKSLVEQTEEDYRNVGLDVGVYYGDRKELNKTHTICTWQSLNILDKKSYTDDALTLAEFGEGVVAVIVDEVHQAKADVLKKLLTVNFANAPIRWGLTGTIPKEKFEYESLRCSLGEVIHQVTAHQLQSKGVLAKCHVNIIQTTDIKEFRSYADEYKYLVTDTARLDWMASSIKNIAANGNTLILVNRIDTGKKLLERIPEAVFISGEVKTKDRKDEYDEVRTSDNKIIVATYGVAAVGINIPRIFNLVLLEPGKSFVRVIQSIGRGIRKAEDKDFVQIWDITSTCKYAKRHLTERKKFYKEAQYPFAITKVDI